MICAGKGRFIIILQFFTTYIVALDGMVRPVDDPVEYGRSISRIFVVLEDFCQSSCVNHNGVIQIGCLDGNLGIVNKTFDKLNKFSMSSFNKLEIIKNYLRTMSTQNCVNFLLDLAR